MPPLNSVQVTDDTTQKTIDPFNNDLNAQPTPLDSSPVAMPPLDGEMGTAEGAALLAGEPSDQPSFQPVIPPAPVDDQPLSQPSDMSVPELPPLPPLPPDDSLPPLPPPPPPIDFSQPIVDQAPSGALTGDVFGDDTTASSAPPVEQTPTPSVPGQFKIPGQ